MTAIREEHQLLCNVWCSMLSSGSKHNRYYIVLQLQRLLVTILVRSLSDKRVCGPAILMLQHCPPTAA